MNINISEERAKKKDLIIHMVAVLDILGWRVRQMGYPLNKSVYTRTA